MRGVFYLLHVGEPSDRQLCFPTRHLPRASGGLSGGKGGAEIVITQQEGGRSRHALISDERVYGMIAKFFAAVQE